METRACKLKGREVWIDNEKGICLFLIIIGHFGCMPNELKWLIYPTDLLYVSAFFFLSGWLFNNSKYDFNDFVKRKFKTLAIPYISISFVVSILDWNLYRNTYSYMTDAFRCFFLGDGVPKASPLWFVSTLFFANILLKAIFKIKIRWLRFLSFLAMPFVCYLLYNYDVRIPFRLDSAFGACFVMYIAQLVKKIPPQSFIDKGVLAISIFLLGLGVYWNLGLLNYNTHHLWLSFPCAIGGSIVLCRLSYTLLRIKFTPPNMGCTKWITNFRIPLFAFILCRCSNKVIGLI